MFFGYSLKETKLQQHGCVMLECFECCSVSICLPALIHHRPVLLVFVLLVLSGPVGSRGDLQLTLQSSTNRLL